VRSLGLDLGGTNVKLAVLEDRRLVEVRQAPTDAGDGVDAVLGRMAALAESARPFQSVGVALPGLFDADGAAVLLPNLPADWTGRRIREPLEQALERAVPLVNDGHAFALAESLLGAGRGAGNVMCIVCGTGIGGGLVLGGRLHLGPDDRAGEFGHHTVAESGARCECGNRGCLELYAGARAIARAAGAPTFDEALACARRGDKQAREAFRRAGELIGLAIANVVIFLCPDRVVVGGGVATAGELLLEPLRASLAARARVAPLERIAVVQAGLGAHAGAIGAALWGASAATESR
jgi:glucokinase